MILCPQDRRVTHENGNLANTVRGALAAKVGGLKKKLAVDAKTPVRTPKSAKKVVSPLDCGRLSSFAIVFAKGRIWKDVA